MNPYIELPRVPVVFGRQDIVLERCRGKRVLHLGCVDSGLLERRYQLGQLMHQKLAEVASELWGLDVDEEGIDYLRRRGFTNLVVGDVCALDRVRDLNGCTFDVIVASELVEHLLNPGQFLSGVRRLMTPGVTELIVTVPNAFRFDTLRWLLRGVEYIHPDHNYWFSYQTITNLLKKTGYVIKEVYVYSFDAALSRVVRPPLLVSHASAAEGRRRGCIPLLRRVIKYALMSARSLPKSLFISWLYRRTPFWGDGIVVIATSHVMDGD